MPPGGERLRLRFGPQAGRLPEQVVLRDPFYVVQVLASSRSSVLADILRGLVAEFDAKPLACGCARCARAAQGVCAYPGSSRLFGYCERCLRLSDAARPRPAMDIDSYEAAVRHVTTTFARGRRGHMRRLVGALCLSKGGPAVATEAAALAFFS